MTDRTRRADLTLDTWNGVVDRLSYVFGPKSQITKLGAQVMSVPNVDDAEAFLQKKSLGLTLPYVAVAPSSTEPNTQSYNAHIMRRWGKRAHLSSDGTTWTLLRLTPVIMTFQVLIVCDDVATLMRIMDRWNAQELWGFTLANERTDGDYRIKIQVQADKSLQVPPLSPDASGSDRYRMASTLRAQTYAGYIWQVPSIKRTELDIIMRGGDPEYDVVALRSVHSDPGHAEDLP